MEKKTQKLSDDVQIFAAAKKIGSLRVFSRAEHIFKEGSSGDSVFFIQEGIVEIQFGNSMRRNLQAGDFFGEIACLADIPRTGTAIARTACRLIELSTTQLESLVEDSSLKNHFIRKYGSRLLYSRFRHHPKMLALGDEIFKKFLLPFEKFYLPAGEYLFREGDASDYIYLILRGNLFIAKNDQVFKKRGPGEFIGEIGVLSQRPRSADVFAPFPTQLLGCQAKVFQEHIKKFDSFRLFFEATAANRILNTPKRSAP